VRKINYKQRARLEFRFNRCIKN